MRHGGIEVWLMRLLRHFDRARFQIDFLCHTSEAGAHDDEARELGARLLPGPDWKSIRRRPWAYGAHFRALLRQYGPYDAVHTHVEEFGGYVLRLAHRLGVPVRIAHGHFDRSLVYARYGWLRRGYLALMRRWLRRHATLGLGCSAPAAASLFGRGWEADPRWRLLYCGIDRDPFRAAVDPAAVRAELGLPAGALVVGHVGRFEEQKNHAFLVRVAAALKQRRPDARLLLVGEGSLRPAVEGQARDLGLGPATLFAGPRRDVARLMLGAMDVFVLPSLYEGLPFVLLEAQAAGLPCVLADGISGEADVVPPLLTRLPLSAPPADWAEAALRAAAGRRPPGDGPLSRPEEGPFDVQFCARQLAGLYEGGSR
jgi:glycosyltransferase involved in cell wall biosynthesis